jgi:DNA-directed RNA polymerase specialized sigma24 family protein
VSDKPLAVSKNGVAVSPRVTTKSYSEVLEAIKAPTHSSGLSAVCVGIEKREPDPEEIRKAAEAREAKAVADREAAAERKRDAEEKRRAEWPAAIKKAIEAYPQEQLSDQDIARMTRIPVDMVQQLRSHA